MWVCLFLCVPRKNCSIPLVSTQRPQKGAALMTLEKWGHYPKIGSLTHVYRVMENAGTGFPFSHVMWHSVVTLSTPPFGVPTKTAAPPPP